MDWLMIGYGLLVIILWEIAKPLGDYLVHRIRNGLALRHGESQ